MRIAAMHLAQIDRHRLAARDGEDRALLDLALQRVEPRVGGDDAMRELGVEIGERVHRVGQHFFGDAAHLGDAAAEDLEVLVVGSDDMFGHDLVPHARRVALSRSGR